ncbi:hypothetical protein [Caulobacter segnis]
MKALLFAAALCVSAPSLATAESFGSITKFASPIVAFRADGSQADAKQLPAAPADIVSARTGIYGVMGKDNQLMFVRAIDVVVSNLRQPCADGAVAPTPGKMIGGSTMGSGSAANCKIKVD